MGLVRPGRQSPRTRPCSLDKATRLAPDRGTALALARTPGHGQAPACAHFRRRDQEHVPVLELGGCPAKLGSVSLGTVATSRNTLAQPAAVSCWTWGGDNVEPAGCR